MGAVAVGEHISLPAWPAAQALYIESGEHTLFGWLHGPRDGAPREVGVVICRPLGYEAICAHRSVRAFAEVSAALGAPTLRFDYSGTGDSSDIDPAADQIRIWTADIVAAVGALQRRTGVRRICLLGIRLGALLAGLALRQCPAVNALIMVAPIVSGRRCAKDIRIAGLAAALRAAAPASGNPAPGAMEIGGFSFSAAALASLARAELEIPKGPGSPALLVIDSESHPVAKSWSHELSAAGMPVDYCALPGMVEMAFTAPQFAAVPLRMLALVSDWLASTGLRRASAAMPLPPTVPLTTSSLRLPEGSQPSITERPVFLGSDSRIFGVLTEPRAGERRRRAVILLNAGADNHIGPSGISVRLARSWARHGYVVLRMDFAGIGDSSTRPGTPDDDVFPPTAVEDVRSAIDFVRDHHGSRDITVAGMCSGAYHALQSAIAWLPIDRILMVNPQNYFWDADMSIHGMQVAELVAPPAGRGLTGRLRSADFWRRLMAGQVDVAYVLARRARRAGLHLESAVRNLARLLRIPLSHDLGRDLEDIALRGVRIVFVFARGEPGIDLLRMQAGVSLRRLGERIRLHIIDGADHVFSKLGPRQQLEQVLSDELYTPSGSNRSGQHAGARPAAR